MVLSLILMALAKAGLVAAYFMHLRFEKKTLALIVISPLALSALIIVGLTPDAYFGWPRKPPTRWTLPGHEGVENGQPEGETPGKEGGEAPAAPEEKKPAAPAAQDDLPA
jgi:hypothetical protein